MIKNDKFIKLLIIVSAMFFGVLCLEVEKVDAMENTLKVVYDDKNHERCPFPCHRGVLRESIGELRESGTLSEDDMKNIESYMVKDREAKEAEIKNKIYNDECEKIDKMVAAKVITKEKGEKLKLIIKDKIISRNYKCLM
ncbi:hypothetical protein [Terrisporobacter sp.]